MSDVPVIRLGTRIFKLPYLGEIRPMLPAEREGLVRSIRENGILKAIIVDPEDNVLDGMNRLAIAAEFALPLSAVPIEVRPITDPEAAHNFIYSVNVARRHLTPKEQEELREKRRQRSTKGKTEGKSTRKIAQEEGVSQTTVVNDLKATEESEQTCSDSSVAERQKKVAQMIEEGKSERAVAEVLKVDQKTVNNDVKALTDAGKLVVPEKSAGKDGKTRKRKAASAPRKTPREKAAEKRKQAQRDKKDFDRRCAQEDVAKKIAESPDPEKAEQERQVLATVLADAFAVLSKHAGNHVVRGLMSVISKKSLEHCGIALGGAEAA